MTKKNYPACKRVKGLIFDFTTFSYVRDSRLVGSLLGFS